MIGRFVSGHHEFLSPRYLPKTLDTCGIRRAILYHIIKELPNMSGILLDIGCGNMPYRSLLESAPSRVTRYIGLDVQNDLYTSKPDLLWSGTRIPLHDDAIDCVIATEVLEHCPDPTVVISETQRVLKPGGYFFVTVPFLWPLHDVPNDESRLTPFALERQLRKSGFGDIRLDALGGWDASLAQILGLWARRRPMSRRKRALASLLMWPIVLYLAGRDAPPNEFGESAMITGLFCTASKPAEAEMNEKVEGESGSRASLDLSNDSRPLLRKMPEPKPAI
jgi:SAM-dependent methyltransferase